MPETNIPILREVIRVEQGGKVESVNGQTGDVVLTAEDVGALPDSTVIPSKTSDLENDSNYQTGDEVNQAIGLETTARENADIGLQGQIDALSAASDVTDIVGTYADLQAYDTSKLKDNDIIKVLQDENESDETTYYRWSTHTEEFTLIGAEGPYYTKSAADDKFQDKLTAGSNITIDANNEISATDTTYTAGTNVSISSGNVISATDTTYSDFTGTDGQTAGTAGLVPAPATTDAGKFLGASGSWETVNAGPTVVQTTGTSQTDVMSQVATTNMVYPSGNENDKRRVMFGPYIGDTGKDVFSVSIGSTSRTRGVYGGSTTTGSIAILGETNKNGCVVIGANAASYSGSNTLIGANTYVKNGAANLGNSVALGYGSLISRVGEVSVGYGTSGGDYLATRYIANVTDPSLAQDAATKNYVDTQVGNIETILQSINSGQGVGV